MRRGGRSFLVSVHGRREALVAAPASLLLAVAMTWPALRHPSTTVPEDLGDPLLQTWQAAWGGHALLTQPGHPFDANVFWPLRHSLAFSDSLFGYAPAGLVGTGPAAALVRYNLLYVGAFALAFLGAYLLARQLGVRSRLAATVAGAAFAYAPWRIAQAGHLHILSAGGIPLALALLLRGHRRRSAGATMAGWLVAAWQLTLGFGLGLAFGYGLVVIAAAVAVRWLGKGRPGLSARLVAAHLGGAAVFLLVGLAMAAPYLAVAREHPEARRTAADVALFSPPLRGFLIAPAEDRLWGGALAGARQSLGFAPEMAMGVGATVIVLAVLGVLLGPWSLRRRLLLAGTAVVALGMGAGTTVLGGRFTYLPLLYHAPGWAGIRTPGRLVVFASLAMGLLGAAAIDKLRRRVPLLPWLAAAFVLLEGLSTIPHPRPPLPPAAFAAARPPLLVLPSDAGRDDAAMFWSTAGFPALANGSSGFVPSELAELRRRAASFPDPASVAYLRTRGVRTVVVLPPRQAPPVSVGSLTRTAYGDGSVRYVINP